jgi:SNF2-related domain
MDGLNQIKDSKGSDETIKRWKLCCLVFQIDPSKTGINETVKLEGLKSSLYQYQAYGVYWKMRTSRVVGGGFLADEMGLGKTLTFLAYIVAERQLTILWKWVLESRAARDGKHLRPDQCHKNDTCPSQAERPNWIACPCASSNPTSRWGPKPGLRLACVPPSLIATWRDQWNNHVVESVKPLDMKLRIAHPPTMGPGPLVIQDVRHNANKKYLGAQKNELQRKGHYGQDTAQADQDRYLILTTRDAYNQWVRTFEYDATAKSFTQSIAGLMVNTKNRGIVFGIGMIDECHEEYHKGKGRSGVLLDLPPPPTTAVDAPFLWGYSGTPLSQTPRELEGVLAAIEDHASKTWESEERYSSFTNQELDRLCKDFDKLIKKGTKDKAAVVEILNRLRPFLKTFMIRRTVEGSWFGRPLIKLKPHIHHDIVLKHNDAYDKHIEQLEQVVQEEMQRKLQELQLVWEVADKHTRAPKMPTKLTFNTECRLQAQLRIMATFPALSILAKKPYNMNFSTEECQQYRSPHAEKGSPYFKHLNQIVESSPKAMYLHWFISQVDKRFELDKQNELVYKKEASAIEQKIVILTYFEPVALILKLVSITHNHTCIFN